MIILGMFKFISVDTLISAEKLLELFDEGGWVEFSESEIRLGDGGEHYDRDELILKIMELSGDFELEMSNFQPLAVGYAVTKLIETIAIDFRIHLRWVIGESEEYAAVVRWLRDGNYFSIGDVPFSALDVIEEGGVDFLDKYLDAVKSVTEIVIETSEVRGKELLTNFFDFCRKSIVSN